MVKNLKLPIYCTENDHQWLSIPEILNNSGKKTMGKLNFLIPMELWKFGDYKSYTSLDLLSSILASFTKRMILTEVMVADILWIDMISNEL